MSQPLEVTMEALDSRSTQAETARQRQREQTREGRAVEHRNDPRDREPALSEHQSSRSYIPEAVTSTNPSDESVIQANPYDLAIIVQPPAEARPRQVLTPPITARLNVLGSVEDSDNVTHVEDLHAVASLMDEHGVIPLAPPSTILLVGRPVAQLKVLSIDRDRAEGQENLESAGGTHEDRDAGTGCVWFTDLTITEMGRYRIRISLMSAVSPGADVTTLQTVDSRVIQIHSDPSVGELTEDERHIIEQLEGHQTVARSPDP
ncbi:MAG: hypothetical protein M1835_001807 [Candelina submexicana]|nr:MAG: hypothetical protein M1835_001807 [Candelina submexicana]